MVNVTVSTNTDRKVVPVAIDTTVQETIDAAEVTVGNVALYVNGAVITKEQWDDSLEDLGVEDFSNATIVAVVKADSAS